MYKYKQFISGKRLTDYGEVFTNPHEVNDIDGIK